MTTRTMRRTVTPVQYATTDGERDPKSGPAAHALRDAGFGPTPAAAMQKVRRHVGAIAVAADALGKAGQMDALHRLMGPIDRRRIGAVEVRLCAGAMLTVERRDAEDGVTRWRWWETRTVEDGRAAIRDASRMIESLHELIAGIQVEHPELVA